MTLLDRARERRDRLRGEQVSNTEQATRRAIGKVVVAANGVLELGGADDRITVGMISPAPGHSPKRIEHRSLFAFTYDGLDFLAGFYWVDGVDHFMLAVSVATVRGLPAWPPENRTDNWWAPAGHKRVHALHQLADAVDAA